ncbi:hypothetical protein AXF42_Ash002284 [Apostasia shenzhenica]|uniref:DUF1365 domain-containing protein n=1 Tax=Apostasia shenzhenica TaxID=1088818 RepID=A0A2I0AN46_9ASPA|nr:hypothetical protein AXF42_Ash002284 [Apostasia shenzhenica]
MLSFLLTIPASVGYEQNPLRVYYCYDLGREENKERGISSPRLKNCIAEVTNTPWAEKVFFVFNPHSDLVAKPLHVSPFMDMQGNWSIRADVPGESIFIAISVHHPTLGNYFTATLSAKRVHSSTTPLDLATYFWLMPHKVAMWIYWQAFKLWWKKVSFIDHPKYSNPTYRDDALLRNIELCSLRGADQYDNHLIQNGAGKRRSRWCVWRDSKWP